MNALLYIYSFLPKALESRVFFFCGDAMADTCPVGLFGI
jgi:hypothetical protein